METAKKAGSNLGTREVVAGSGSGQESDWARADEMDAQRVRAPKTPEYRSTEGPVTDIE